MKIKIISHNRGFILPLPSMLMGGLVIALTLISVLFYNLYLGAIDDFSTYRASVEVVQDQIKLDNDRKLAAALETNQRAAAGWRSTLDELSKRPAVIRVRVKDCGAGTATQTTPTATGVDAATAESQSSTESSNATEVSGTEAETIIGRGIRDAAQVLWLQDYILGQQETMQ